MNRSMLSYVMGVMMLSEGALMLVSVIVALIYQEYADIPAFVAPGLALMVVGFLLSRKRPKNDHFYAREGFLIVALSWLLVSFFGAFPFYLSGEVPHFIDCFFESVSGFTTTGSTALPDIEGMSHCIIFWRAFTHWIGGMGILVFVLLIMPKSSGNSIFLMRAEMPGVSVDKLVSKVGPTVRILYCIYLGLSALLVLLLVLCGMPLFDSIVNMFATAGTGGFSVYNSSIAAYDSALIDVVLTVFMLVFAVNFNVYFLILVGKAKDAVRSEELRWFLRIVAVAIIVITCDTAYIYGGNILEALRYSSFQVASIISTTGFATYDYNQWPEVSRCVLLFLMIIGSCAGSTGGGMKISRLVILWKQTVADLKRILHPRQVVVVHFEGRPVDPMVLKGTYTYLVGYLFVMGVSILLLSFEPYDFFTDFSSIITCLGNVGPAFNLVGPTYNFHEFSVVSKLILAFDMVAGRLEIFPMLILFSPFTWRK